MLAEVFPLAATVLKLTMADAERQETDVAYFHPDRLLVEFSRGLNIEAAGPHSALNTNNWRLVSNGTDVSHYISFVQASSASALAVQFSEPLPAGNYRLIVRDLIHDDLGRPLDGDDQFGLGGNADITFFVASATSAPGVDIPGRAVETFLPVTASDVHGNYVVVWIGTPPGEGQSDESPTAILAQRYNAAGERLGELIVVDEFDGQEVYSQPLVSMSQNGSFVVVWSSSPLIVHVGTAQSPNSFARRFDSGGQAVGEQFTIAPPRSTIESIAVNDEGHLAVGYRQSYTGSRPPELFIQRYDATNALYRDAASLGPGRDLSLMILNSSNSPRAVWIDDGPATPRLMMQIDLDQQDSNSAKRQLSWLPGVPNSPVISARTYFGEFVVAWDQELNGVHHVMALRVKTNGPPPGQPQQVSQTPSSDPLRPAISQYLGDSDGWITGGSYVIAWDVLSAAKYRPQDPYWLELYATVVDAEPGSIRARAYDPTGTPRGDEFAIGSIDASSSAASVISTADGELAVAWLDGFQYVRAVPESAPILQPFGLMYMARSVNVRQFSVPTEFTIDLNGGAYGVDFDAEYAPYDDPIYLTDWFDPRIYGPHDLTVHSITATIAGYLPGDLIESTFNSDTITASFQDGVLTLSGASIVYAYQYALQFLRFSSTAERPPGSTIEIRFVATDEVGESKPAVSRVRWNGERNAQVVGTHVFYNNSVYDNMQDGAANDAAIAPDKTVLLPDSQSTAANVTNYVRGINGLMIDIAGSHGTISADDFVFRIGSGVADPQRWAIAADPIAISMRPGAGVNGSDRLELIWEDGVIRNAWLEVLVRGNYDTGLADTHMFFIGNRVADSGNEAERAQPETKEALAIINRLLSEGQSVQTTSMADPQDFNRDGRVNSQDLLAVFNELLARNDPLKQIRYSRSRAEFERPFPITGSGSIGSSGSVISGLTTLAEPLAAALAEWDLEEDESQYGRLVEATALLMQEPDDLT